ncbi:hypothetical protein JAAARDRAFT_39126 [Jaapia argillacea MUCL 33604]|uniref:C2 domain-containing protein n=1 Tax=Jaapia argillacea MUCL 33604 TaxID=933084 RepID=A0A067PIY6_9AGAM|nr:hypothetical protein JAAARDRAFT_39126 [Jaapia argillacea MUCL 33604]
MNQTTTEPNLDQPVWQRPADENGTITLVLTILGAQDLHKHRKQVPNCFVRVSGGSGEALTTRRVKGANPHDVRVDDSSRFLLIMLQDHLYLIHVAHRFLNLIAP